MFNIGPAELIVIFLVALLVVGPKRLPELGRTIGRSLREFRRATDDFKQSFEFGVDDDDFPEETPNGQEPNGQASKDEEPTTPSPPASPTPPEPDEPAP
jgi:Tat protein translocase TatB subunit